MNPITELCRYISGSIAHSRSRQCFSEVLSFEACEDIGADIVTHEQKVSRSAYSAAVEDEQADADVETVLADGKVTADEVPILRRAQRNIRRSAKRDRQIAEATTL